MTLQMKQDTGGTVTLQAATSGTATATVPAIAGVVSVELKGADIASATTTDLSTATGDFVDVTGTTTITGLGTIAAGVERTVRFTGALTLTHNATSLILPGAANITTAANDRAIFRSLGSGNWLCVSYNKASGAAVVSSGGGLTNWSESAGTYSSKDWKRFYPVSGTNVNAVLSPLGTGSIQAQVADGTSTGGNQRGPNAVDWQTKRNNANQVASGYYSVVSGGLQNKATGAYSGVCGGWANTASGNNCVVSGGNSNTASGTNAIVGGGNNSTASGSFSAVLFGSFSTASGDYSVACGRRATTRGTYGMFAFAGGYSIASGASQMGIYFLRKTTTDGTPAALSTSSGTASSDNQVLLPNNSAYSIDATVTAHRTDVVGTYARYTIKALISRGASAAATTLQWSSVTTDFETDAAFACTVAADTTNGAFGITVTGASGKTVRWLAVVYSVEVTS